MSKQLNSSLHLLMARQAGRALGRTIQRMLYQPPSGIHEAARKRCNMRKRSLHRVFSLAHLLPMAERPTRPVRPARPVPGDAQLHVRPGLQPAGKGVGRFLGEGRALNVRQRELHRNEYRLKCNLGAADGGTTQQRIRNKRSRSTRSTYRRGGGALLPALTGPPERHYHTTKGAPPPSQETALVEYKAAQGQDKAATGGPAEPGAAASAHTAHTAHTANAKATDKDQEQQQDKEGAATSPTPPERRDPWRHWTNAASCASLLLSNSDADAREDDGERPPIYLDSLVSDGERERGRGRGGGQRKPRPPEPAQPPQPPQQSRPLGPEEQKKLRILRLRQEIEMLEHHIGFVAK